MLKNKEKDKMIEKAPSGAFCFCFYLKFLQAQLGLFPRENYLK